MRFDDSSEGVFQRLEHHMRQMARNIHEGEVRRTKQLDFGSVKEAIVVFADESGVFYGFFGKFLDVGFRADNTDVIRVPVVRLVCQCNVLPNEHTNADTRHVEAVEEGLYGRVDLHALLLSLVFVDTLGNSCDDGVVPPLDLLQCALKFLVVVCELRRPVLTVVHGRKVASGIIVAIAAVFEGGISGCLRELGLLRWFEKAVFGGLVEIGPRQGGNFFE